MLVVGYSMEYYFHLRKFALGTFFWRNLTPISTHRPTQEPPSLNQFPAKRRNVVGAKEAVHIFVDQEFKISTYTRNVPRSV